jgi:superfamily II DNA or RNA helicase
LIKGECEVNFKNLSLKQVYDNSVGDDMVVDLFEPLLSNSRFYYRGVGYFTSGWLTLAYKGLNKLIENGGKAVFITSPHLNQEDWISLKQGAKAAKDKNLYKVLAGKIGHLEHSLKEETLTALSWLVADGLLEFYFAIPKNNKGNFHDKFGVFIDDFDHKVAIHGSFNDSIQATYNGESFSVFKSWEIGQAEYVETHFKRFLDIINCNSSFYNIFPMDNNLKDEFIKLRKSNERPYQLYNRKSLKLSSKIKFPSNLNLYPFQREGIEKWLKNNCIGMFEMATGTGKTFTSLASSVELHNKLGSLAIVVSCPFNHLVDQWEEDVKKFGYTPMICRSNSREWVPILRSRIQDYNIGARNSLFIITTHKTSASQNFLSLISSVGRNILLIADEVHYLGSNQLRKSLLDVYNYRIGLSATPDRWFDENGTETIKQFFGETVADMPLEQAIGKFLTPYNFYPHTISLTRNEMEEFADLTKKITNLMMGKKNNEEEKENLLDSYIRKRASIVSKAQNKIPAFIKLMKEKIENNGVNSISHTIVYCSPGQTNEIVNILTDLGLKAHEFVYKVKNKNRIKLLKQFDERDIQILVAIKCLDEGVNIPATKEAFFLSSTSNPREFVQRRGRILRKYSGKNHATLHDFVVIPPMENTFVQSEMRDYEKILLRKEMPRFAEFSSAAQNFFESRNEVYEILFRYDLLSIIDKKPWDLYKENKEKWGDVNAREYSREDFIDA